MARAATSRTFVSITNVEPTMLLMRSWGREFTAHVRDEVQTNVSPFVAARVNQAAAGSTEQARPVAGTFRAVRDRLPAIRGFGARRVTSTGARASDIGFGANFGGGQRRRTYTSRSRLGTPYVVNRRVTAQFGPYRGPDNDRFIYSTVERYDREIQERWQQALDDVYVAWNRR
jgi:hypothetical protein